MASLINLTRGNEIGANCYYLDLGGRGILLDSGMHPKAESFAALPHFDALGGKYFSQSCPS